MLNGDEDPGSEGSEPPAGADLADNPGVERLLDLPADVLVQAYEVKRAA
jgi:hypothetical protein